MKSVKELNKKEMQQINGGATSYGNGVYCNKKKCWVNKAENKQAIAGIVIGGWASSLAGMGH
ncbi:class II bacteriocin [Carnobacterium gallinarum]|uniref:class II bacteriocin n=1 Tax=Carnobacterium gallinarum TaxID=2749 RepID=UPI000556D18E|nr:class II bacteriocin [Carnobacterium gallinarum]